MTNKHIELPAPYQREVYATAENTESVRKGFEMGGYVKSPDLWTREQIEDAHEQARVVGEPAAWTPSTRVWHDRIKDAHPNSNPEYWPNALKVEYMEREILDLRRLLASPPAPQEAQVILSERLHDFLDAAAGQGYMFANVDAADLYAETFPERYNALVAGKHRTSEEICKATDDCRYIDGLGRTDCDTCNPKLAAPVAQPATEPTASNAGEREALPPQWLPIGLVHLDAISRQRVRDYADSYARAALASKPVAPPARLTRVEPEALRKSILELEEWERRADGELLTQGEGESIMLILHELKTLLAATPTAPAQDAQGVHNEHCACSQWVIDYGHDLKPGEHHHRDCKKWHRVIGSAIVTKTEFMVLGDPCDDEEHNCDAMGCSSVSHVLVRLPLAALRASSPADTRNALRADHPLARGQCIHNISMSENCRSCAPKEFEPRAIISGYTITEGFDGVKVERAQQMAGPAKWAVRRSGNVLSRSGEWDWEPTPSSRTPEWLAEHRFDTASEAIEAAHGIVTKEST